MNTLNSGAQLPIDTIESLMEKPEVSQILEWTFKYAKESKKAGLPYNTSFFKSIGGVSYAEWQKQSIEPSSLIQKTITQLTTWQSVFQGYRDGLQDEGDRTQIEREGVQYIIDTLEMAKIAVPIELEKASKHPILSDTERKSLVQKMDEYQTKLYGEKLSENLDEIEETLALMRHEWQTQGQYLTDSEKEEYLGIYVRLIDTLEKKYPDERFEVSIEHIKYIDHKNQTTKDMEGISMHRSVYIKLWRMFVGANNLKQKVTTSPEVSSIFDGPTALLIPRNVASEEKNIMVVLKLMIHEIGVHFINQRITEEAGFVFRGAKNLEKEEGLAILCEELFEGKTLEEIKRAGYSFPYILVGELLGKTDRQKLADLRVKMDREGKHGDIDHERDIRIVRGYPDDSLGAQRKDMSYGRGLLKIIRLIESGKFSLMDFFVGKFSIEDIESGRIKSVIPKKEKRDFPLLFPEMLLYMFAHGRENFTHGKFSEYLREKYNTVLGDDELESIEQIQEITKLKVFINMWKILDNYKSSTVPPQLPIVEVT